MSTVAEKLETYQEIYNVHDMHQAFLEGKQQAFHEIISNIDQKNIEDVYTISQDINNSITFLPSSNFDSFIKDYNTILELIAKEQSDELSNSKNLD